MANSDDPRAAGECRPAGTSTMLIISGMEHAIELLHAKLQREVEVGKGLRANARNYSDERVRVICNCMDIIQQEINKYKKYHG